MNDYRPGHEQKTHRGFFPNWQKSAIFSAILTLAAGCSNEPPASTQLNHSAVQTGQFRGYGQIKNLYGTRLFDGRTYIDPLQLGKNHNMQNLKDSLGAFDAINGRYVNGTPNPVNTTLWNLIIEGTLEPMIRDSCSPGNFLGTEGLNSKLSEPLIRICQDPALITDKNAVLTQVWLQVMNYEGSYDDLEAYLATYSLDEFWQLSGKDRVETLLAGLLLSPGFLLEP